MANRALPRLQREREAVMQRRHFILSMLSAGLAGPLRSVTGQAKPVTIRFENRIPGQVSTIHWHGMPVPAAQDGNPMNPVASGSRHVYEFVLPADSAGSYWYHPHPHRLSAEQGMMGLLDVT
jgi:FtsP/CotA-like multicopper oxidase with cupredoxin domain